MFINPGFGGLVSVNREKSDGIGRITTRQIGMSEIFWPDGKIANPQSLYATFGILCPAETLQVEGTLEDQAESQ